MRKIRIGIIGFGTIGAGVVKALKARRPYLREKSGIDIEIARICDKDLKTKRPVKVEKKLLTKLVSKVLYDPSIDIVVELMGGIHPAKEVALETLRSGKHFVTANKALLSDSGHEIFSLAHNLGLCVGFEASVGGGVPIIRALKEGFVADHIDLIYGIINGTSNFILTKMAQDGLSFKDALAIAQAKGYAERDPGLDISGGDSAHKLSVLALLGFGAIAKPAEIYTEGITGIEACDLKYAGEMGYSIKLLGIAKRSGKELELRVHPTLLPKEHLLSNVNDVYNAIFVKGDLVGDNLFYGKGAGAAPTSGAVVSDIVSIAKTISKGCCKVEKCVAYTKDIDGLKDMADVRTRYYMRLSALDKPGVLAKISGVLAKYNISIALVSQKMQKSDKVVPVIMMTHEAREQDMAAALEEINSLKVIKRKTVSIRVEA